MVTDEDYTDIVKLAKQIGGEGFNTMGSADIAEFLEEEPIGVEQALNIIPDEDDDQEDNVGRLNRHGTYEIYEMDSS